MRVLQRVVMPIDRDLDVLKLYVDGRIVRGQVAVDEATAVEEELADDAESGAAGAAGASDDEDSVGRRTVVVPLGRRVSFCTYFNAFPASYWRRWTTVGKVQLRVRLRGEANVIVYRSNSKGHSSRVTSIRVDSDTAAEHVFPLSLQPFIDGGWYWFDIVAGERNAVLERAEWCAEAEGSKSGRVSLGITTFNRPAFCVEQLLALGAAPEVLDIIDEIFVVDQGTRRVEDHPDFAMAAKALGGRLRLIDQGNLGGSGGFARAMDETVQTGSSDYVLLLDDDVVTEPEGILRAVTFADLARTPTIVGGHMFSLYDRSVLHAYGEALSPYRWFWGAAPHTEHGHDFAERSLRGTPWLHRRIDVDYNGWWMCLIPVSVIKKIGLSMPMFIKWDDAEYGVRAKSAGFPTASLPGVAVWHVPWHDKDDTIDWQAYFHERNRLVSALLHSPYEHGGNLLKESLFVSIKHALAMQYSTAGLMLMAIEDILKGPGHMHCGIVTKMAEIREFQAGFPDTRGKDDLSEFPAVRRARPPRRGRVFAAPNGRREMLKIALVSAVKHAMPHRGGAPDHPAIVVPHVDQQWWLLAQFDGALVSSADGTKAAWYQRDSRRFRSVARRSVVLHARLLRDWERLRKEYRAEQPEITSPERWRETFQASLSGRS
jgi:galactofuranosylgalactofuranosylrhamnosyl-N-acetylglucosaminyl-diphospho-decaprenol beta-1,5/1,6-galactofuranosyltransferase